MVVLLSNFSSFPATSLAADVYDGVRGEVEVDDAALTADGESTNQRRYKRSMILEGISYKQTNTALRILNYGLARSHNAAAGRSVVHQL